MDVVSLSKASKALRNIQNLNDQVVAPLAESRFPTVDARLDWLEGQAGKILAENSKQLDLSQGTFTNTELVNGKIQLKLVGLIGSGYTGNIIPKMTSNTTPEGVVLYHYQANIDTWAAFRAFNQVTNASGMESWGTYNGPYVNIGYIGYKFTNKKAIVAYSIKGNTPNRLPKTWTFEGLDDSNVWHVLDTRNNITDWVAATKKTFEFSNTTIYIAYRINYTAINGGTTECNIDEIEMMESAIQNTYVSQGTYESPIIDLGEGWNKTGAVDIQKFINTGTTNSIMEIAISTDGSTFSEYALLDPAAPPQGRYVKIRATLSATPLANPSTTTQYDQSPETKVTLNEYSEATGDLKLKNNFTYEMEQVSQDTDGQVIRATIPKSQFSVIQKVEVK
jgi:hypothetical protein